MSDKFKITIEYPDSSRVRVFEADTIDAPYPIHEGVHIFCKGVEAPVAYLPCNRTLTISAFAGEACPTEPVYVSPEIVPEMHALDHDDLDFVQKLKALIAQGRVY